ncbi:polysaccharide biosynthesis/export family protein [Henriciella litoralis]|uniref:polysaccharide biosynthesis/export family protein n=1 Tax=Henriciella litoralis TaxID=568102 RepID=UPI000A00468D|nr:polysaccharide biosynthesis/export family protein [Henriciella litoralis]
MRSLLISTAIVLGACQNVTPVNSTYFPVADWRHEDGADQPYLLAPGDTIQLVFHSAPELDREVKIAPDGSISLPFIGAVQASARTSDELQDLLLTAYSNELRDPQLDVIPVGFDSQRIFVGGEVATPGMMELPGQIDPLQAIIMAGGFTDRAKPQNVALMRRMPGGEVMTAVIDVNAGINDPRLASFTPLRRFDVVYVPRSAIAQENLLMQQWFRSALPIDFSLYYDIAGGLRR